MLLLLSAVACSDDSDGASKILSERDYGDDWPFVFSEALFHCEQVPRFPRRQYVTFEYRDRVYALNGTALGIKRWHDGREFMRRNEYGLYEGSSFDVIADVLELCDAAPG